MDYPESPAESPPDIIGLFSLVVNRFLQEEGENFAVAIDYPNELAPNIDGWIQATACMLSRTAKISGLGYEKTLEVITEQAYNYRDIPLNPPAPPAPAD